MNRYLHIDVLRAVSIIGMILIHVLVYNFDYQIEIDIWNYLHFVVAAFVFCSGYVLTKYQDSFKDFLWTMKWYKKRVIRIAIPYYLYFFTHFALALYFPTFFSGIGIKTTPQYFLNGIILFSNSSLSWLALLFIELTLLFPLISYLKKKNLLKFYFLLSLITAALIPMKIIKFDYRLIMWLPWSILTVLAVYFYNWEKQKISIKKYLFIGLGSGAVFLILNWIWNINGMDTLLISNKYPPNLFNLSYGISISMLVLILARLTVLKDNFIKTIYNFFSVNSYSLFFIHYLVLDFVLSSRKLIGYQGVAFELDAVFFLSVVIVLILNKVKSSFDFLRNR